MMMMYDGGDNDDDDDDDEWFIEWKDQLEGDCWDNGLKLHKK